MRHRDGGACDVSLSSVSSALQAVANPFDCVSLFQGVQSEPLFLGRVVLLFFEGFLSLLRRRSCGRIENRT